MKKAIKTIAILLILIIAIAAGVLFLRPNLIVSKLKAKADLTLPTSHFINWRNAEIHYTVEGTGFPILMVHGFGGSVRNFTKLTDSLKNEYRIVRIDLPGFGLSDMPELQKGETFINLYQDYMQFIIDTLDLDSMYLIGNSMGGMVAWNVAAFDSTHIKKMVLLNAAGYELDKIAKGATGKMSDKRMLYLFEKVLPLTFSEGAARKCFADGSKIDYGIVPQNNEMWNRQGNIQAAFALACSGSFPDSANITKVSCPTLIIWGEQDEVVPVTHAQKFKRDIKNSQLIVYNPCGHVPMIEVPELLVPDLRKFFAE